MLERAQLGLGVLAALGCGLVAGTFFAFSSFVMPALARLPAPQGIAAMQSINVTVLNRSFLGVFIGTAVVCLLLALAAGMRWQSPASIFVFAAAFIYVVACFGVTMARSVPLNDALAAASAATPQAEALWTRYLAEWTGWNTLRAWAAALSMALFIVSLRV